VLESDGLCHPVPYLWGIPLLNGFRTRNRRPDHGSRVQCLHSPVFQNLLWDGWSCWRSRPVCPGSLLQAGPVAPGRRPLCARLRANSWAKGPLQYQGRPAAFAGPAPECARDSLEQGAVKLVWRQTRRLWLASETALWYHGGKPSVAIRWVLIRDPKGRFEPQALLATDPELSARQIVGAFVRRWTMETTFQEARASLGIEGQRQWNDLAIARSTPIRLALFSLVALIVQRQPDWQASVRAAAWYEKTLPTFSDALAQVRRCLWRRMAFCMSSENTDKQKSPAALFDHFGERSPTLLDFG
jgi:hypothetical protein